jgi:spore coat protein CotH
VSLAALTAVCVLVVPTAAAAQTSDELFDSNALQEIRLFINSRDLGDLRTRFTENTHYPADLQWRGIRVRNVSVRSHGLASRNPAKLSLQVDFDSYTRGQTFLGLKSLVLDNLWTDPSMVRDRVAMAFFARMGQPAPRESYCRLYINNSFEGLYVLIEPVDPVFVARTTGDGSGYLFSLEFATPFFGEFLGEDFAAYKLRFEARSRERESDTSLYAAIRELFRTANQADDATWAEAMDPFLDLSQFMTHVAIEVFLAENDGVLGGAGMANVYLYRDSLSTRHRLFVWDKDTTFFDPTFTILTRSDENVIFRRASNVPALRSLYLQVLADCARAAAADGWLEGEINRTVALIDAVAREDPRKRFSNEEFDAAVAAVRDFARIRPDFVLRALAR